MNKRRLIISVVATAVVAIAIIFAFMLYSPDKAESDDLHDILVLQNLEISSFDPLDAYHAGHIQIVKQLYNTLVDIDLEGNPAPSLAHEWTTEDGKIWRFHLRKDVLFQEDPCFADTTDRRFDAQDVLFTFERLLAPESVSLGVSYFSDVVGVEEYRAGDATTILGLRVVNDHTIDIELSSPDFAFAARLTLPYVSIVNELAVSMYGDGFAQHPVGTGPFLLTRHEPNTLITLGRNVKYWEQYQGRQLPAVPQVHVHLVTDENRALLMFRGGEVDFVELSRPMYEQYQQTKLPFQAILATQENPQINMYLCNLETINTPEIRHGMSRKLDRSSLKEVIAQQGVIANSLFPPSLFPTLAVETDMLQSDPMETQDVLSSLNSLRLVCFEDVLSRAIAERYAESLKEAGVNVQIEAVPFPVLVERLMAQQYDLIQLYWGPIYTDPGHYLTPFLTRSFPPDGNNFNRYSNPDVDALVANSRSLQGDERHQDFLQAQKLIIQDMPFVLLYFKNTLRASNQRFDMPLHPLQYRLYKYAEPR